MFYFLMAFHFRYQSNVGENSGVESPSHVVSLPNNIYMHRIQSASPAGFCQVSKLIQINIFTFKLSLFYYIEFFDLSFAYIISEEHSLCKELRRMRIRVKLSYSSFNTYLFQQIILSKNHKKYKHYCRRSPVH